ERGRPGPSPNTIDPYRPRGSLRDHDVMPLVISHRSASRYTVITTDPDVASSKDRCVKAGSGPQERGVVVDVRGTHPELQRVSPNPHAILRHLLIKHDLRIA